MSGKARRYKAPRISQVEVNQKTSEILEKKGADKHIQAVFFNELSKEVSKSENPRLSPFKPHIKIHRELAWGIAYQIVTDFLAQHEMSISSEVMRRERSFAPDPMNVPMLLHVHGKNDVICQILRKTAKRRSLPRKEKIAGIDYVGVDVSLCD